MKSVEVPEDYAVNFQDKEVLSIGPPAGVSREHCVDAMSVCVTTDWQDDGMGAAFIMFFQPDEEELAALNRGAKIKLTIRGMALQPHALGLWG